MIKGLFLYNPSDLHAKIPGGVQICSQEFLKIIEATVDELHHFEVRYNRSLVFRLLHRLNLDNYISYATKPYHQALIALIKEKQIGHIFINKSELIRFSKLLKKELPEVKIIIMSHGNDSGDFLGDLTGIEPRFKGFKKYAGILKLGLSLYTEAFYRKRYVDLVCTMSEEESAIEKWLGINHPFYIPRLIQKDSLIERHPQRHVFGYVGTLNHTPNIIALTQLFDQLRSEGAHTEIRIVGQPKAIGENLAKQYPFVRYLGPLSDEDLFEEVKNWGFFINPIFNYSRGASMKLAKAIEWEIPILTTIAGRRGYLVNNGSWIETDNTPKAMAAQMHNLLQLSATDYESLALQIKAIKASSIEATELGQLLRNKL